MASQEADRKAVGADQHEIEHGTSATPEPEKKAKSGYVDEETAAYAGNEASGLDEKTNRSLFWKTNKRILACMLGVCLLSFFRTGFRLTEIAM